MYPFSKDTWKESCAPRSASVVLSDRLALCSGVCHVVSSMPLDIQSSCFQSLTSSLLDSVETISAALQVSEGSPTFWSGLSKLSSGVSVMASFPGMTAPSSGLESNSMDIGCDAPTEQVSKIPEAVLEALGRTWPMLRFVCENYSQHQVSFAASRFYVCVKNHLTLGFRLHVQLYATYSQNGFHRHLWLVTVWCSLRIS